MTDPQRRMAEVLVELAGSTLLGPHDTPDHLLTVLTERCVELLDGCAAATAVVHTPHADTRVAGSSPDVHQLELDAVDRDEGPAHDCRHEQATAPQTTVLSGPVARQRWPRYCPRALSLGHTHATSLPLTSGGPTIGGLVLLSRRPIAADVLALAEALAAAAAIALERNRELQETHTRVGHLEHALSSRILIEQAKGVLSVRLSVTVDEAFALLRRYARTERILVHDVAQDVVEGRLTLGLMRN